MIEGRGDEKEEFLEAEEEDGVDVMKDIRNEEYGMSLNAFADCYAYSTILIRGCCQGRDLIILIDSGSTHSFIDEKVIKGLKAVIVKTTVLTVIVANGNIMKCDAYDLKFKWFI